MWTSLLQSLNPRPCQQVAESSRSGSNWRPGMFQRPLVAGTVQSELLRRAQVVMSWSVYQLDFSSHTAKSSLKHCRLDLVRSDRSDGLVSGYL